MAYSSAHKMLVWMPELENSPGHCLEVQHAPAEFLGHPWIRNISCLKHLLTIFLLPWGVQWNEPRRQKTGLRGFRPGPTQIRLRRLRKWLEAWNFVFRKERDCTICVVKTKALISFTVTTKLICVFVFAFAKIRFSHVAAQMSLSVDTIQTWWQTELIR